MNSVHLYISEDLDAEHVQALKTDLLIDPWVSHVEISERFPHDLLVEYEQHHLTLLAIMRKLNGRGVHADVTAC